MNRENKTFAAFILASALGGACLAVTTLSFTGCSDDSASPTDSGTDTNLTDGQADASEAGDAASEGGKLYSGQVDRAGRPAIIAALISEAKKDSYNSSDPLDLGGTGGASADELNPDFQASLVDLDMVDGVNDWDGGSPDGDIIQVPVDAGPGIDAGTKAQVVYQHPLLPLLMQDTLILDVSKPFSPTGYLEIEYTSQVLGAPDTHVTCGGRWPGDDAVDKTMSLIVKKSLTGISDGVSEATKAPSLTFPYLAPPN